jgi:hypothetical protein
MNWRLWARQLLGVSISGGASSVLAVLGMEGAEMLGIQVHQLTIKEAGIIFVSGAVVKAAEFLRINPIPKFTNTQPPFQPPPPSP